MERSRAKIYTQLSESEKPIILASKGSEVKGLVYGKFTNCFTMTSVRKVIVIWAETNDTNVKLKLKELSLKFTKIQESSRNRGHRVLNSSTITQNCHCYRHCRRVRRLYSRDV